jgi:hypothetical protein
MSGQTVGASLENRGHATGKTKEDLALAAPASFSGKHAAEI